MSKRSSQPTQIGTSGVEVGMEVTILRSNRVVLNDEVVPAEILISSGTITNILRGGRRTQSHVEKVLDVGDLVVMPGVVDCHVHINEPGRTDWEGYYSATRAAAAGGITTVVDMPLNCIPPTTTLSNFHTKLEKARGQCHVDVAFWGGVIPGNQAELVPMLKAGVLGFKCFLIASGVEEFPHVCCKDLEMVMNELQGTDSVLLFHAEEELDLEANTTEDADPSEYSTFLATRPDSMEVEAIQTISQLCLRYKVRCHVVHLSTAQALPVIREARRKGAPLTVETTHHYLTLAAGHIPPGGTYFKCCPPIRSKNNQEQLWLALRNRDIDMVVSDHSPCTPDLKHLDSGDFLRAWGGISSLQLGLPLFWTSARRRGFSLRDVAELLCKNPAKLSGLGLRKGSLLPGLDADLVIWDPDEEFQVTENMIQHKHKLTPYLGFHLQGKVFATVLRGRLIYMNGKFTSTAQGDTLLVPNKVPGKTAVSYY
ncbi:allantoinase, mitochondrial-like [Ornithorhynchus anatinus]|uniref:allantoinase n=1 Tax=Ornithorhynchus anatinus TaxID=9258 RepID=F7DRE9_ORNAN|nr:allantoinase, mitochondrial-like [Ornithorhynchus anatinus]